VLGFTNDRVGAALLGLWNLPATVVTAVACGHELPSADAGMDSRTVLALAMLLENELLGLTPARSAQDVEALAAQLGVSAQLPVLRDSAAKEWLGAHEPEAP
jgi:HD-like signal output (HDOD) protein